MRRFIPEMAVFVIVFVFFYKIFLGLNPIPSDTIVGLYYPYRDIYSDTNPNGLPFKNFLITDPVRQIIPWKFLAVEQLKNGQLPGWNPYSGSGYPLIANYQSAFFYPLNIFYFIFDFIDAWTIILVMQFILGGIFMTIFLRNLRLNQWAVLLGSLSYVFSGFFVSWYQWNTLAHVAAFIPLAFLSIDKLLERKRKIWFITFFISGVSIIFSGHMQTAFYAILFVLMYLFFRLRYLDGGFLLQIKKQKSILFTFLLIVFFSFIQIIPTIQFIFLSNRLSEVSWRSDGWFIPVVHLIQFIAPDFFGNPSTMNYWGTWNYGEMVGYIGIVPLIFSLYAISFRREKAVGFFASICFLALIFSVEGFISTIPFYLNIPFISSAQPTRLILIIDFSLCVLSAFGFDYFLRNQNKIIWTLGKFFLFIVLLWIVLLMNLWGISEINNSIAKNNLILPTLLILFSSILLITFSRLKNSQVRQLLVLVIFLLLIADLFRFFHKFSPFSKNEYFYPESKTISYLKKHIGIDRYMAVDDSIIPPNFSIMHKIQSVGLYDPLYLKKYAEFIVSSERNSSDISPPFGFNRIITPKNFESPLIDFLGVKYIISKDKINSEKLTLVLEDKKMFIYENNKKVPRYFFAENVISSKDPEDSIRKVYENRHILGSSVVVEQNKNLNKVKYDISKNNAILINYSPNEIRFKISSEEEGFFVLSDTYYPTWRAETISEGVRSNIDIHVANHAFRGVELPKGKYILRFYNKPI